MDNASSRSTIRKTTISKSTPTFGFSDVDVFAKSTHKRLHSPEKNAGDPKEISSRKIAKIHSRQDILQANFKSPAKILAEQRSLWRQKTKLENEKKTEKINKRKENLKELHEKSKLLLKQNLNKKERKIKNTVCDPTPLENQTHISTISLDKQFPTNTTQKDTSSLTVDSTIKNQINSTATTNNASESSPSKMHMEGLNDDNNRQLLLRNENAAKIIQRNFRRYIARSKEKLAKNDELCHSDQKLHEDAEENTNKHKIDALALPDLYIRYPFNIISSVKSNLQMIPNEEQARPNNPNDIEEENYSAPQSRFKPGDTNTNVNESSIITDNSKPSEISTPTAQNLATEATKNNMFESNTKPLSEINGNAVSVNYTKDGAVLHSQKVENLKLISKYSKTPRNIFVEKGNILNAPEVNLIWLRRKNKQTLSPKFLQNSFQDELKLLESFNDSLKQVQNIEKSLTSIRVDDISSSDVESVQTDIKENNSTRLTFLGTSDMSVVDNKRETEQKKNVRPCTALNTKQLMLNDNDKSLVVSQKGNVTSKTTDTSDIFISESDSIYDEKIKSCLSSTDLTNFDEKFLFNFHQYENSNMTSRLNRFCLCLVSQYIEDEKVRSEYLNTLLKVREKTLLDATRNELLCLEMQKKQNHSQIPFLKKKQRGLLLKLQQERTEIKHIKKFQYEQSQERKASLRRQLKHIKQMLACEEMMFSTKKKNKNSTLNISRHSINSPLKGINITIGSETQTTNNSLNKIWECLEKRRQTLNEQKQKMHDLLHLHVDNIFDSAEIQIIREKLSKIPSEIDKNIKPMTGILATKNDMEDSKKITIHKENTDLTKISNSTKRFSGNTLNVLWEKITGHSCNKFEDKNIYNMTKDSLELFFTDAKQVAINNMLSTLQHNVKAEIPKQNSVQEPNCLPSNKIESTSFLNNLLKSEGRELADLISKDKEAQQDLVNKTENSFSNDGSDTSKSTAHSLVDELSYLYPNIDNYGEAEKENHTNDSPIQQQESVADQNDSNVADLKESEDKENANEKKSSSSIEPIASHSSFKIDDPAKITLPLQKIELKIPSPSNLIMDSRSPRSSNLIIEKPTKISKGTNTVMDKTVSAKIGLLLESTVDANNKRFYSDDQSLSRLLENKSPVNTDYLVGSWDSVSPSSDPSPRDSPTGEYSPAAASLPLCHLNEAEELRRKQLAIELEIKALEQQQTQLPYCLVREIPDKPPPPYIPPSEEKAIISPVKVVEPKSPPSISSLIESFCSWLWNKFSDGKSEIVVYSDYCSANKFVCNSQDYTFIFDVCLETFQCEFSKMSKKDLIPVAPWEYKQDTTSNNEKTFEKTEMCNKVESKVKDLIGIETTPIRENLIISWTQKRQDFVNNLLIKELYREEADWLNIEPYEKEIKNDLTNSILSSLILEACNELKSIIILT